MRAPTGWLRVGSQVVGRVALMAAAIGLVGAAPVRRPLSDLRVRSEANETVVETWVGPTAPVTDHTPGSRAASGLLLSSGATFAEEIRFALTETPATSAASVIVGDPRVSQVRVLRRGAGSMLVIFVRQPVQYEARRVDGGTTLSLHIRPLTVTGPTPAKRTIFPSRDDDREVTLDAEVIGYEKGGSILHARGGVAVTRPGMTLMADEVQLNRSTHDGEARGNVVLQSEGVTLRGEYLELNLTDETGSVESGEVDLPQTGYTITGGQLHKGYGQTYRVQDGVFTTCKCGGLEAPSWSIAARDLDIDLYGRGKARNVTFRIRDVPVLYVPFGIFPVNRLRHSGLLRPQLGHSLGSKNKRGFEYEQPFFWAINKSTDATLAFRVETEARVGVVGEYRYALGPRSRGAVGATYFNENLRTDHVSFEEESIVERPPEDRWAFYTKTRQEMPGGVRGYLKAMVVSDDLFFREIETMTFDPAEEQASRTQFYTATRAGALKEWRKADMWAEATFYQDLDLELKNEDERVFQRVPVVEVRARDAVLNDRLALAFAGQGINYQRDVGFDGLRLDLHPEAQVPFHFGRYVFGALEGSVRGTLYHQTDTDQVGLVCVGGLRDGASCVRQVDCEIRRCEGGADDGQVCGSNDDCARGRCRVSAPETGRCETRPTGERLERDRARGVFQFGWRAGTEISRVYAFRRWGFSRLKHSIEPVVRYMFIPRIGGQEDLPLYDGIDRINRRSLFSYGLVSRLKARYGSDDAGESGGGAGVAPAPQIQELAEVSVLHAYDTQRKIAGDNHFSDLDINVNLTPHNVLALNYGATYNVSENVLKGTRVTLLMREPWVADDPQLALLQNPSTLALTYRFVDEGAGADPASVGVEELTGSLYLRIARFLGLLMHTRFNLLENLAFERGVSARFVSRCNCWMVEVGVIDRQTPEDETVLRAQLVLSGLGSIGREAGGRSRTLGLGRAEAWP